MTIAQVLGLLHILDGILSLGGKLISVARQVEPKLRTEDPGALDDAEAARLAAIARIRGGDPE